jgi:hypothetical protein
MMITRSSLWAGFDTPRSKETEILQAELGRDSQQSPYLLNPTDNTTAMSLAVTFLFWCFPSLSTQPVRYAPHLATACFPARLSQCNPEGSGDLTHTKVLQHVGALTYSQLNFTTESLMGLKRPEGSTLGVPPVPLFHPHLKVGATKLPVISRVRTC